MQYFLSVLLVVAFLVAASGCKSSATATAAPSSKIDYLNVPSRYVQSRNVEVWLPRQYFQDPTQKFPVLYMHDGQNLFNAATSYTHVAWEVDNIAQQLMDEGKIKPAIIVGIWNSAQRREEYFPQKAANYFTAEDDAIIADLKKRFGQGKGPDYLADRYLQFMVKELKPWIDANYRTRPDRDNTFIAGSSMGGLISMYAVAEYPDVFAAAACLSTHWPILENNDSMSLSESVRKYMVDKLPAAGTHRFYFDFGTETLDQFYEVHQIKVDAIMREKGYVESKDWTTKKFPGAAHNERSWQRRMDVVLEFLLK